MQTTVLSHYANVRAPRKQDDENWSTVRSVLDEIDSGHSDTKTIKSSSQASQNRTSSLPGGTAETTMSISSWPLANTNTSGVWEEQASSSGWTHSEPNASPQSVGGMPIPQDSIAPNTDAFGFKVANRSVHGVVGEIRPRTTNATSSESNKPQRVYTLM